MSSTPEHFAHNTAPQPDPLEHWTGNRIDQGAAYHIDLEASYPLDTIVEDELTGTRQGLYAVVEGSETRFGVVRCELGNDKVDVVARFGSAGEGAQLAGVFYERNNGPYDESVKTGDNMLIREGSASYSHDVNATFNIKGGVLDVVNTGGPAVSLVESRHGVYSPHTPQEVAFGGIKKVRGLQQEVSANNGPKSWELSPEQIREAVDLKRSYHTVLESEPYYSVSHDIAERLARTANAPGTGPQAKEILLHGQIDGRDCTTEAYDLFEQRFYLADVADRSPETIRALHEGDVAAFHGARSSALGSIVEFGGNMHSSAVLNSQPEKGLMIMGGDTISSGVATSDYIAFSVPSKSSMNWIMKLYADVGFKRSRSAGALREEQHEFNAVAQDPDISEYNKERALMFARNEGKAADYIDAHPDSDFAKLTLDDFPVVFGISHDALFAKEGDEPFNRSRFFSGASELNEVRPDRQTLALGGEQPDLTVVGVPHDKIDMVRGIFERREYRARVVAIEDLVPSA